MSARARGGVALAAVVVVAVGIVAFVAYGRAPSGTPAQRLAGWASSTSLGQAIGTLEGDAAHVRAAAAARNDAALRTVCSAMANDAQTFNDSLPSPDATATQWLAKAYGLEYDAAQTCYRGAGATGAPRTADLARSARDRSAAAGLFARVESLLEVVTGSSVPTTTTTVPSTAGTSFL